MTEAVKSRTNVEFMLKLCLIYKTIKKIFRKTSNIEIKGKNTISNLSLISQIVVVTAGLKDKASSHRPAFSRSDS